VVDLDRDGDPDVVAALAGADAVVWYENLRPSSVAEPGQPGPGPAMVPAGLYDASGRRLAQDPGRTPTAHAAGVYFRRSADRAGTVKVLVTR